MNGVEEVKARRVKVERVSSRSLLGTSRVSGDIHQMEELGVACCTCRDPASFIDFLQTPLHTKANVSTAALSVYQATHSYAALSLSKGLLKYMHLTSKFSVAKMSRKLGKILLSDLISNARSVAKASSRAVATDRIRFPKLESDGPISCLNASSSGTHQISNQPALFL